MDMEIGILMDFTFPLRSFFLGFQLQYQINISNNSTKNTFQQFGKRINPFL